jgi:hypothetical protein
VADLGAISRHARSLQGCDEPRPQLWNAIETALREEGLIRATELQPMLVLKRRPRWSLAWLMPVAASALVVLGVLSYQGKIHPVGTTTAPDVSSVASSVQSPVAVAAFSEEDQKFLTAVAFRTPALREKYERGLRDVNAYIRDAKLSAQDNPNDEEVQRYLMNAYDQKAMLYQMAIDRSQ